MTTPRLQLTREQILAFRRRVSALDERLPMGADSLRQAAWAGLQDSMPRAALLSLHARVADTQPDAVYDPSLIQIWGPRYSAFVVAAQDIAPFTLGRLPDDEKGRRRAESAAQRLRAAIGSKKAGHHDVGEQMGVNPNSLRYGTVTGEIAIRWEGARQPTIWMLPRPDVSPHEARDELARRYLHVFGPTTAPRFAEWAGISLRAGEGAFESIGPELTAVKTPVGDAWILATDESAVLGRRQSPAPARLLPSGDPYFLLWGVDRELLLNDQLQRSQLWTSRVWPGALLVNGEIVGVWRRASELVTIEAWRQLAPAERTAVEEEAAAFPLPDLKKEISVSWAG